MRRKGTSQARKGKQHAPVGDVQSFPHKRILWWRMSSKDRRKKSFRHSPMHRRMSCKKQKRERLQSFTTGE
jgi:hypothetical protein